MADLRRLMNRPEPINTLLEEVFPHRRLNDESVYTSNSYYSQHASRYFADENQG